MSKDIDFVNWRTGLIDLTEDMDSGEEEAEAMDQSEVEVTEEVPQTQIDGMRNSQKLR